MQLVYNQEKQEINFRIDNSPLADSAFASQKEAILQKSIYCFLNISTEVIV